MAQTAIATRLQCAQPHHQVARQWFSPLGILAFLPLGGAQGSSVAVVWSAPKEVVPQWLAAEPEAFCDMLSSLNWQADASSVRVGFGQPYAVYHEWGTKRMPRRGLLFENPDAGALAPDDEKAVLDLLMDWLDAA